MKKYENLSNGTSDGIVLFYMKDGKLKPIALTKDQADMLDVSLKIAFGEKIHVEIKTDINVKGGIIQ